MTRAPRIAQDGQTPAPVVTLAAMRERQHGAARMAAAGASERDIAAFLGMPLHRARALLERPAMRELVAHYRRAA